jgi:hypothetical protein
MRTFAEQLIEARKVSTPFVVFRTFDPFATVKAVAEAFGNEKDAIPFLSWDAIHGLRGLNDEAGTPALAEMAQQASCELSATVDLPIALGLLEFAEKDVICFLHNPHMFWEQDKKIVQGVMNLRSKYTARGNMLVLVLGAGDELPIELQQDCLVIEVPLPTREELGKAVESVFKYAAQEKAFAACKDAATPDVVKKATDALIGLPLFPAAQATSIHLNKLTGVLDVDSLWTRKKEIVSQQQGLSYHQGSETLADMHGCEAWVRDGIRTMEGKYQPTIIVRMDEIQRQLAGSESDSSGTKGNLMGEFLTWVNDRKVICTLNVGVSGTSKSWGPYCLGGQYGKPVINYSISAMEHKHVGESSRHMRNCHRTLDAIGDGRIWLIASANSLEGLPPELISRFQKGGIYFFDVPDATEREGIMKLKVAAYGLTADQPYPDMMGWTGRDIDNCAAKADLWNCDLVTASKSIVPLLESHRDTIEGIRSSAHNRFLSASHEGLYQYVKAPAIVHEVKTTVSDGRKFRT